MLAAWDADLRCRFANNAYRHWFGADPNRMLGMQIQDLLGPDLFRLNEPYMRQALAGEEQLFERLIVSPDGVARHSLARYIPEMSNGAVVGFFVEVTDVSRLKVTELALRRQIERLNAGRAGAGPFAAGGDVGPQREVLQEAQLATQAEAENQIIQRAVFLAQLAHELRNSLSPIRAGTTLLTQRGEPNPKVVEQVGAMISRQASHMSRLIDDVFDLSAMEAGAIAMHVKRVDLRHALQQALDMSAPLLREAGHTVTLHGVHEALYVDADLMRLTQVFSNLLNNAAKYTPPRGRISVAVLPEGSSVRIEVRDDGIGMPADAAHTVFDLFAQLPHSAGMRQGGLGIGLALVRQIVLAHGGSVSATSAGHRMGSTFIIRLPLPRDRRAAARTERRDSHRRGGGDTAAGDE